MRATRISGGLIGMLLAVTGCADEAKDSAASGPPAPTTSAAARLIGNCLGPDKARLLALPAPSSRIDLGVMGNGSTGVVIAYELSGRVCTWLPLADKLVARGYRVALFDYSGAGHHVDVGLVTAELRKQGVSRVFIIGGSIGGSAVLEAGGKITPPVAGVVNLAGGLPDGVAHARLLRVPLLLVAARDDPGFRGPTTSASTWMNQVYGAAAKAPDRRLVLVPGYEHASELFAGPQAKTVEAAIIAFLHRHGGP
jgi:pimeloyl-ACP methyl ester carboxylesterase